MSRRNDRYLVAQFLSTFTLIIAVALSPKTTSGGPNPPGAEILMTPVNPPAGVPPYPAGTQIVGQELRLPRGGVRVWLEFYVRNWDSDGDGTPRLLVYQMKLNGNGFHGPFAEPPGTIDLHPAWVQCAGENSAAHLYCHSQFGPGDYGCIDRWDWSGLCPYPYCCKQIFANIERPDWIAGDVIQMMAESMGSAAFNWVFFGIQHHGPPLIDGGLTYYVRTLVIDVPAGARGNYTLGFEDCIDGGPCLERHDSHTFLADDSQPHEFIYIATAIPAVINVQTGRCCYGLGQSTKACEDNVTVDECDALPAPRAFLLGEQCTGDLNSDCADILGACCDHEPLDDPCRDDLLLVDCNCAGCEWHPFKACDEIDCSRHSIPTVSQWGLVMISLLLLTGAKITFGAGGNNREASEMMSFRRRLR